MIELQGLVAVGLASLALILAVGLYRWKYGTYPVVRGSKYREAQDELSEVRVRNWFEDD